MELEQTNASSVAIVNGDKVLLIQRAQQPYAGAWTLPGGRREPGETPEQCAVREIREELGVVLGDIRLLYWERGSDIVGNAWRLAVFAASAWQGDLVPSEEIADYRWVTHAEAVKMPRTPDLETAIEFALGTHPTLKRLREQQEQQQQ